MLLLGLGPLCPPRGYVACPVGIRILMMVRDRVNIQSLFPSRWAKEYDVGGNRVWNFINELSCFLFTPGGTKFTLKCRDYPKRRPFKLVSNKLCKKQKRTAHRSPTPAQRISVLREEPRYNWGKHSNISNHSEESKLKKIIKGKCSQNNSRTQPFPCFFPEVLPESVASQGSAA